MVAVAGVVELWETRGVGAPVEVAAVDDDAADGGAVAADPFRGAVHDDVGAVGDRAAEVAPRTEGVVHHDGHTVFVCYRCDGGDVRHVVSWVTDAFDVDHFRLVVDLLLEFRRVVAFDEARADAEPGEEDFELVVGAAVEVRGRDDVVAGVGQCGDGHELGGLARGSSHGGDTAFERGDALFEDVHCGLGFGGCRLELFSRGG